MSASRAAAIAERGWLAYNRAFALACRSVSPMKKLLLSLLCLSLLSACGEPEDTRPGQPVKTRQAAFKELLRQFEPMGKMLRDGNVDTERFLKFATALDAAKEQPWSHFGPDTQYPPSKSLDAVWQNKAAFDQARERFIKASGDLLIAAQSLDKTRLAVPYKAVYESCQDCHHDFRKR